MIPKIKHTCNNCSYFKTTHNPEKVLELTGKCSKYYVAWHLPIEPSFKPDLSKIDPKYHRVATEWFECMTTGVNCKSCRIPKSSDPDKTPIRNKCLRCTHFEQSLDDGLGVTGRCHKYLIHWEWMKETSKVWCKDFDLRTEYQTQIRERTGNWVPKEFGDKPWLKKNHK